MARSYVPVVEIGGIPISLSISDEGFRDVLCQRYRGFLSTGPTEFELRVDLVQERMSDDDVRVRREGEHWRVERGDFCALWDPASGRGWVRQFPHIYSFDSLLRIVHSLIIASHGGFLLHAASAVCDGSAYLFPGVSGAGKTTLTRLAPAGVTLLSDEISYVRPDADGYLAYGTPFSGELAKPGENRTAPIRGLFFLEKGSENRVDSLPPAEGVRRLMRNVLFFAEDHELIEKLFLTACDFVSRIPTRRLTFYPHGAVWDIVRHFQGEPAYV